MIDFKDKREAALWHAINDDVMGGRSQGEIVFKNGLCVFSGDISLENNGGFSSVFKHIEPLSQKIDRLTIDVIGDGLTYQLRVITYVDGYRLAYKHHFATSSNKLERFVFLLKDFIPSFRGRIIDNAPELKAENIQQIGLLVKNNTEGPFSLRLCKLDAKPMIEG